LIIVVPGPWQDRIEFVTQIVGSTEGEFMFAGLMLANLSESDHIAGIRRRRSQHAPYRVDVLIHPMPLSGSPRLSMPLNE
jgi:hypothetical protein